jgi:hypothetical protein
LRLGCGRRRLCRGNRRSGVAPGRGHPARLHRGHRARARAFAPAPDLLAHAAEETCVLRRGIAALQFPDAGFGTLEEFVLHQHRLHQCVDGVRRLPQTLADGALGVRIARIAFQRGEAVEQFVDQIAFLWGHWPSPGS